MKIELTELIEMQMKTISVMFCAGIFTETLWQIKNRLQYMAGSALTRIFEELFFWAACGAALSEFLYYCSYGKISLHAAIGFLAGLLLWKRICCAIITPWQEKGEVKNSKTTAASSILTKRVSAGTKKGRRRKR